MVLCITVIIGLLPLQCQMKGLLPWVDSFLLGFKSWKTTKNGTTVTMEWPVCPFNPDSC